PASLNEDHFQQTLKSRRTSQNEIKVSNRTTVDEEKKCEETETNQISFNESSETLLDTYKSLIKSKKLDQTFETIVKQFKQLPASEEKTKTLREIAEALYTLLSNKEVTEEASNRLSLSIALKSSKIVEMIPCKHEKSQTLQKIVTTLVQQAGSKFD